MVNCMEKYTQFNRINLGICFENRFTPDQLEQMFKVFEPAAPVAPAAFVAPVAIAALTPEKRARPLGPKEEKK